MWSCHDILTLKCHAYPPVSSSAATRQMSALYIPCFSSSKCFIRLGSVRRMVARQSSSVRKWTWRKFNIDFYFQLHFHCFLDPAETLSLNRAENTISSPNFGDYIILVTFSPDFSYLRIRIFPPASIGINRVLHISSKVFVLLVQTCSGFQQVFLVGEIPSNMFDRFQYHIK
jgi:hypothetical protein